MALKMLRARLYEMEQEKQRSARDAQRKSQAARRTKAHGRPARVDSPWMDA